ncbi:hypothetical protein GCM10027456_26900 [Kineosporia babensis]
MSQCRSRHPADRPARPPPTITTSFIGCPFFRLRPVRSGAGEETCRAAAFGLTSGIELIYLSNVKRLPESVNGFLRPYLGVGAQRSRSPVARESGVELIAAEA